MQDNPPILENQIGVSLFFWGGGVPITEDYRILGSMLCPPVLGNYGMDKQMDTTFECFVENRAWETESTLNPKS